MLFELDQKIIEKTTKCNFEFKCLNDIGAQLCQVEYFLTDGILILGCNGYKNGCNYRQPFDERTYICKCPARNEIFTKYGM